MFELTFKDVVDAQKTNESHLYGYVFMADGPSDKITWKAACEREIFFRINEKFPAEINL